MVHSSPMASGPAQSVRADQRAEATEMHDVTAHDRGYETRTASFAATRLTIIIPTLNERDNIEPLVTRLISTLPDIAWEALFVDDDSHDGTSECVRALARRDPRVRCLQRIGRRG